MPRNSAGTFTLVPGNPVQSGDVVSSTWANSTLDDVADALTDSLDREGRGGMLAPFRFADGTNLLPGASWVNENTTGFYRFDGGDLRVSVLTQDVMRWKNTGAQVWNSTDSQWENILSGNSIPAFVNAGTVENQTLRWDDTNSDWKETSALLVDSFDYVGIGSDPIANRQLTVESNTLGTQILVSSTSYEAGIAFYADGSTNTFGTRMGCRVDDMTFSTAGVERMRIDVAGNVGIGEDVPDVKLVVVGDIKVTDSYIAPASDGVAAPSYSWDGNSTTGMYRISANQIGFATNGINRMSIKNGVSTVTNGVANDDVIAGNSSTSAGGTIYLQHVCSQAEYDALTPNGNTLYIIV